MILKLGQVDPGSYSVLFLFHVPQAPKGPARSPRVVLPGPNAEYGRRSHLDVWGARLRGHRHDIPQAEAGICILSQKDNPQRKHLRTERVLQSSHGKALPPLPHLLPHQTKGLCEGKPCFSLFVPGQLLI